MCLFYIMQDGMRLIRIATECDEVKLGNLGDLVASATAAAERQC